MGMSASALGREVGLTGQEMNFALKQADLLRGAPQTWAATEPGAPFATEHWRQHGGGGARPRGHDFLTWDPKVLEVLDLDLAKKQAARAAAAESRRQARLASEAAAVAPPFGPPAPSNSSSTGGSEVDPVQVALVLAALAAMAGVGYGVIKVAPHVKRRFDTWRSRDDQAGS